LKPYLGEVKMAKKNPEKVAKIKLNQKEAKVLLKSLASKSALRDKLIMEIREEDSRLKELKHENIKLGGFSATEGMKPKRTTFIKALTSVMKPGKKMSIPEIQDRLMETGAYDISKTSYPRERIGSTVKTIEGVERVGRGVYVLTPQHKKKVSTPSKVKHSKKTDPNNNQAA
jgi:hypothetical protein